MRTFLICFSAVPVAALLVSACAGSNTSAGDLDKDLAKGGTASATAGTNAVTGGAAGSAVSGSTSGGSTGVGGMPVIGTGGSGTGGQTMAGGGGGAGGGTGGGGGGGGVAPVDAYSPRTGSFKMLVYSATKGYRHADSIVTGKAMLQQIATEQGFEVKMTETNEDITPEGLKKYEIVFFMNSTGDIFNETEQATYEAWMRAGGAFGGTHSATDTENGWAFYSEVTGQYYNGHSAVESGIIQLEPAMVNFPALKGQPNPWQRTEEWYKFDNFLEWSVKPGFKMLGRKQADGQPIMWVREWGNFRSFYTALGHQAVVFEDPQIKKHVTGGIMWAVRREALIK